ncbi:NAD(P)/FAD-dependent oxidoreductase [Crossiella sp. SN42]|uniref:NAD(P)/FAD-dependent oxidoreductase n=1 Tax=Crossiella sp. SN42 TaxID=2944808 RepID=UPI00207CDD76|nr:NAD(P)/FAD-dependent oxidoreductase [Crossiella sp. SN42]MCO1574882.1 NAD(P)/FAD-dependent oxidoreductase [Crossiella sp. SN42]
MSGPQRIVVVGGGYVGMYTALRLQRKLRAGEATITVVDPQPNMTYQPFLPEAAAGSIEPRHVVVPLRKVLRKCTVLTGRVTAVDAERKIVTVLPVEGVPAELAYDHLVLAPGAVARTLPVPGLAECGIGFGSVGEAIHLRNHVLSRLDVASTTEDEVLRRRALTFVVVGAGYAGIEVFGELEDMARAALRHHPRLSEKDMRWVLVEAADRVLPEVSPSMAEYTVRRLRERGTEVRLGTRVSAMDGGQVVLTDGEQFAADTVVWTAGVKANPLAARSGLPVDSRGRLLCTPALEVIGVDGVWSAGDCAAVPDLSASGLSVCAPSAQHAVRQAKVLADNLRAAVRGRPVREYRHKHVGSVASLGLHKGVAEVYGIRLRGFLAWLLHRLYHLSRVPTFNRKVRVLGDWVLTFFCGREVVSLGQVEHPRRDWAAIVAEVESNPQITVPKPFSGEDRKV